MPSKKTKNGFDNCGKQVFQTPGPEMAECALATSTLQKPAAGNASWPATISDIYTTWVNGMDVDECEMVSLLVIAGCHLPAFFF